MAVIETQTSIYFTGINLHLQDWFRFPDSKHGLKARKRRAISLRVFDLHWSLKWIPPIY